MVQMVAQLLIWLLICSGFQLPFTGDLPLGGCFHLASVAGVLSGSGVGWFCPV